MAILLLVVFAGSNLFLVSKPGREFLEKNLNRRAQGLSWQISGASWSPWNGITVKNLSARLRLPDQASEPNLLPLVTLREAELKPYWGQLMRGKKLFREVVVNEPVINLPVEYLVTIKPVQPTPQPAKKPKSQAKPKPKPSVPQPPQKQTPKPAPEPQAKPKSKPKPKPKVEPVTPDEKQFWIRLRKAKLRLYSVKLGTAIDIHSLNANLPLAGPETKGDLSWQSITLDGQSLLGKTSLPIEWKHPNWTLPNQILTLGLPHLAGEQVSAPSLKFQVGGVFSPRKRTRDFRFNASLPAQPIPDYLIHDSTRFHFRAQSFAANFSSRGRLIEPASWRVDSAASINEIQVFSEVRGQHFHFDSARANLKLQNATLLLPNFSILSEELSLMGNGQLHLGGYLLAVARVVAAPEHSDRITKIAVGSLINRGWSRSWLSPLETPDRYYRDLHFEGFLPNAVVNTGKRGAFVPLPDVIRLLRNFTNGEVKEELPKSS